MSAAEQRTRLKASIWAAMQISNRCDAGCGRCAANVAHTMERAFMYADAVAKSRIEQLTPDELRSRLKLAEATAEADRKTS